MVCPRPKVKMGPNAYSRIQPHKVPLLRHERDWIFAYSRSVPLNGTRLFNFSIIGAYCPVLLKNSGPFEN